ncbi:MAG: phosphoribosylformylglycinamidine synthase subunit PurL [Candidatus Hodarchaeota archaeon]
MNKTWFVSIYPKSSVNDPLIKHIKSNLLEFGIKAKIQTFNNYMIHGNLNKEQIIYICENLLFDHVSHEYLINEWHLSFPDWNQRYEITIKYKQGVMDATGLSVKEMIKSVGLEVDDVRSSITILLQTTSKKDAVIDAIKNFLVNELIQDISISVEKFTNSKVNVIPLSGINSSELMKISKELMLSLNEEEMQKIQQHFRNIGRDPYDVELETIAQTWSEHCVHKTFNGVIYYQGRKIQSLLRSFIMKATTEINADWCVHVFDDNAGIIKFNDNYGLAVKVETHNHPTALDPYGGAGTGSGGVFRDVMGVGGEPILSMDSLFFGFLTMNIEGLPKGIMHPKRLMKGSVAGIRDYGNKMGIPTANGSIGFHKNYLGNPLIFAGCVGILPLDKYVKNPQPGDLIVLVGGRTGRDGIHGVTFASGTLTSESEVIASSAVQIGNPLEQKRVLDALIKARDHGSEPLYSAITDCGGGGLSSAVGEMGKNLGVIVELDKVPLKYEGLAPWEIWVSESQERMLLAVPCENVDILKEIFELENCDLSVIGQFTDSGSLNIKFNDEIVSDLDMEFLHKGIPKIFRNAVKKPFIETIVELEDLEEYNNDLRMILSHPNVASKEWVIRQYDHEVRANTIIKPLQGKEFDSHGDSCVIKPLRESWQGFVVSNGFNPNFSANPRKMALSSIDEAIRNNICSGGRRIALLDNFSWGNPEDSENLGALVEACQACYESAVTLGVPFISGKDSLYNDFQSETGDLITIPHTLLITGIGLIPDVRKSVTTDFKSEGNYIYLIGETLLELGGSLFYEIKNLSGGIIPDVNLETAELIFEKVIKAIDGGLIQSCHDCSEGGLAVSLAEMCFGGNIGAKIDLKRIKTELDKDYKILFSESNTRFVVEVQNPEKFEKIMKGISIFNIGYVEGDRLIISGLSGRQIIDERICDLKSVWKRTFDW